MKNSLLCFTLALLTLFFLTTAQAKTPARNFVRGVNSFQKGNFKQAIADFLSIAESGVENGDLFYNLGNAYFKTGDLGHAIYWYERAMTFIPRNADLRFNLDHARSLTIDDQPPQGSVLTRVLFFWKNFLSARQIRFLTLGINLLVWISLGILAFWHSPYLKGLFLSALILLMALAPTALFQLYRTTIAPQAIILPEKTPVRSGRNPQAPKLFVLHAGTKVTIQEITKGYAKIAFGKNLSGWIKQDSIGVLQSGWPNRLTPKNSSTPSVNDTKRLP